MLISDEKIFDREFGLKIEGSTMILLNWYNKLIYVTTLTFCFNKVFVDLGPGYGQCI